MRNSLIVIGFFAGGILLGIGDKLPGFFANNDFSNYALFLLMFLVGVGIGSDKNSLKILKEMNTKILLIPLGIIAGTMLGTGVFSIFIQEIKLNEILAISAGFGYYSLSSIYITQLANESLGVIALLSNIIREIFTLIATPLLVKHFGKLAGIASGAATSMDTTLPIIVKYSGKEWAIISVFSGVVLTILVPFIITLLL